MERKGNYSQIDEYLFTIYDKISIFFLRIHKWKY